MVAAELTLALGHVPEPTMLAAAVEGTCTSHVVGADHDRPADYRQGHVAAQPDLQQQQQHHHQQHHHHTRGRARQGQAPGGWDGDGTFHPAELAPAASTASGSCSGSGSAGAAGASAATSTAVALSNKALVAVDLADLPQRLASLSVAANALTAIDLSPLRAAPALNALILNANALAAIDLSALAHTPALERLWLHNNALTTIDLTPLAHCASLRSLYLDANRIDHATLDLSPIAACKLLRALRLGKNALNGHLDITPILGCAALSTLDVSASVKLSARVAARPDSNSTSPAQPAAPSTLPPALRRRAATVHWIADDFDDGELSTEDEGEEENDKEENDFIPSCMAPSLASTSVEHQVPDACLQGQSTLAQSGSLEELASLCTAQRAPGSYVALLVGFRGASRFASEALLEEHGGLVTAVVASSEACSADAITRSGALTTCSVIVVHPDAESLIVDLRSRDATIPIVVVGNAIDAAEQASRCLRYGASCFFTEPLDQRDALALRSMAQQRSRAVGHHRRRSPSPPPSAAQSGRGSVVSTTSACIRSSTSLSPPQALASHDGQPPSRRSFEDNSTPGAIRLASATSVVPGKLVTGAELLSSTSKELGPRSPTLTPPIPSPGGPGTRTMKRSPSKRSGLHHRARPTIDFACLRSRVDGITTSRTNRVEDSAVGMLFSRCGGRAFPSDFGSVATLCGLPVCASLALHAAAKSWVGQSSDAKPVSPSLSPVSVMEFAGAPDLGEYSAGGEHREVPCSSTKIQTLEGKNKGRFGGSSTGSVTGTKSMSAMKEMLEQVDVENRQAEGVSYEMFHEFWSHNLSNRDCETRLFNVLRIAHKSECSVPVSAVRDLAAHFVSSRSSDMDPAQMRSLASSLLCYELKGLSWQWIGRHELRQARLCGSLLAAESGMYNGVAANLRADRMSDIRMAFAAASGKRVGGGAKLSVKDIIWLNAERGLFTPRAVEAIFEREVCDGGMDLAKFAPMWLAATNPDTRPSCEYLFGILDADADGYINAFDAAHFYMEKRRLLLRDGYIPTAFEHVWRGLLDSVANGKVRSPSGRLQVSLTDLRSIGSRDWTVLFQSLLFMDDDMAMVDIVKTSNIGSAAVC